MTTGLTSTSQGRKGGGGDAREGHYKKKNKVWETKRLPHRDTGKRSLIEGKKNRAQGTNVSKSLRPRRRESTGTTKKRRAKKHLNINYYRGKGGKKKRGGEGGERGKKKKGGGKKKEEEER